MIVNVNMIKEKETQILSKYYVAYLNYVVALILNREFIK
jgi:hypothetical protein